MKTCLKCLLLFPITEFYNHKGRKDGLDTFCKICRCAANKVSREKYKDRWSETRKLQRKTDPTICEKQRNRRRARKDEINAELRNNPHRKEWRRQNRIKNKEHEREIDVKRLAALIPIVPTEKTCRQCHLTKPAREFSPSRQRKDGLKSYCKDCHSKNSVIFNRLHHEATVAARKKRRAKIKGAKRLERITHTGLAQRDLWRCHICKGRVTKNTWSIDHLIPLSQGGDHTWLNIALAHRLCNIRRNAGRVPAQLRLLGDLDTGRPA